MKFSNWPRRRLSAWLLIFICLGLVGLWSGTLPGVQAQEGGLGSFALNVPSTSSPIAFANNVVWLVNPDDDSVSLIDANTDTLVKRIFVGDEPQSVALGLDNTADVNAYVANAADNTVTVIKFNGNANNATAVATLTTGAEPWNVVARPAGNFVYVANSAQDTISVIRTSDRTIVSTFNLRTSACNVGDTNRHFQPRGLAITGNGGFLFVSRFLSFTTTGGKQGDDTGKEGVVCRLTINGTTGALTAPTAITLPAQDTGFTATIGGVETPTSAYPNQMQSVVICGNGIANEQAYLPNIAASPDGPLKFNVDTQAFVNRISNLGGAPTSAGALNLHLGAREPEAGKTKLFFANPWAMACNNPVNPTTAYVVSAGSDLLVKLNVAAGALNFTVDSNTTRYIDLNDPANPATSSLNAGKNPLGIVINDLGTKAYVMNYISRNVSVIDLATDSVTKVIKSTDLPPAGSQAEQLQVGAEMFFSSRGVFDGGKVDRLSSEGWQNCASCHFAGLTDGNIWVFGAGPRKAVPINGSFSPHNPDDQRMLNYSAIFDEVEDFEANIRNVSGPGNLPGNVLDPNHGLLIGDNGDINAAPAAVNAFALPNAGRPQLTVTLPNSNTSWPALEALREWTRFAIRTPNGMLTDAELPGSTLSQSDVNEGRRLFFQAGCQACHGGTKWTISNKDFVSPPGDVTTETDANGAGVAPDPVATQYIDRFLAEVGTFNLGVTTPVDGKLVGALEKANRANTSSENGFDALGIDYDANGTGPGFNIPALLGIGQLPPYYHNGSCETLACVLSNQTHRSAGRGQDILNTAGERSDVVAFLQTLDAETEFPLNLYVDRHDIFTDPPTVFKGTTVSIGANISLFGTKADLAALSPAGFTVRLTFSTNAGSDSQQVTLTEADFNQDFGQAVVEANFSVPADVQGNGTVTVEVDSDEAVLEARENDNEATRRIRLFNPPPDRTPPVVNSIFISDDSPFNDADQIATTRNVQVKIVATDPASPSPAPTSGLESFCLVRYAYSVSLRRWVEESCVFRPLPDPVAADTFIVDTQLRPFEGVGYVFAWVKDGDGNISRTPGFDFISFIPGNPINLNRNDVRLFRISTASPLEFTFTPSFGDVDVSVFQGFGTSAVRCELSANNGVVPEVVTIGSAPCTGTDFQIEVRAIANSRFTVNAAAGRGLVASADEVSLLAASNVPLVGGPPALRTAIADETQIFLPVVLK